MRFFRNFSVKWKVVISIAATSTLAVCVTTAIFATMEVSRLQHAIEKESLRTAQLIGANSVGALAFSDQEAAHDALKSLTADPKVINAVIYDEKGQPFAWYEHSRQNGASKVGVGGNLPLSLPQSVVPEGSQTTDQVYSVSHAITMDGSAMGAILLRVDLSELQASVTTMMWTAAGIVLGALALSFAIAMLIQQAIVGPIHNIANILRDIAEGEGDLTRRINVSSEDEIGELAHWFNVFAEKIRVTVAQFRDATAMLNQTSDSLAETSQMANQGTVEQQNEINQVAAAVTEMAATVQEVVENVNTAADDATQADGESHKGKSVVADTMSEIQTLAADIQSASDVISRLQQDSENIGSVLDVIRGIAEQTNLLALNAAIEAARAGEQGRGFAVVADEVRTLASRTQTSTEEIHEMIERLQSGAREAVHMMEQGRIQADSSVSKAEEAGSSLAEITRAVSVIKDMTNQIAHASQEQSQVTEEINSSINNISMVAKATADGSQHNLQNCQEIVDIAKRLDVLVDEFQV